MTGGAGYVGSHACKALYRAGFLPIVYDNLSNGRPDAVRWGPLERGQLSDTAHLRAIIARYRPVGVLHFAALIEAGRSVIAPRTFYETNVAGTLSLVNTMIDAGVRTLVMSSTAAVYGEPATTPIAETHALNPVNPYGRSKLFVEEALRDVCSAERFTATALRYFNAAGADPDGDLGEDHDPETHLIPLVIQTALGLRESISVFGTDYETPDGTCVRDYVHVSDLAQAHVLALQRMLDGGDSLIANLGTNRGYTVRDVIGIVEDVVGREIHVVETARRPGDPARLVADATLAKKVLGWRPRRSELRSIVKDAVRWIARRHQISDAAFVAEAV